MDLLLATLDTEVVLHVSDLPPTVRLDALHVQTNVSPGDEQVVHAMLDIDTVDVDGRGIRVIQLLPERGVGVSLQAAWVWDFLVTHCLGCIV